MLYLAAHEDRLCSIGEIAAAYGISQNHLMKVASDLAGSGYVQSLRGRGGGLRLARAASQINIGHMIRHTEGKVDLVGCGECPLAPACGMVCVFKDAVENFFVTLDRYSLSDIMTKGQPERLRLILAPGDRPPRQLRSGRVAAMILIDSAPYQHRPVSPREYEELATHSRAEMPSNAREDMSTNAAATLTRAVMRSASNGRPECPRATRVITATTIVPARPAMRAWIAADAGIATGCRPAPTRQTPDIEYDAEEQHGADKPRVGKSAQPSRPVWRVTSAALLIGPCPLVRPGQPGCQARLRFADASRLSCPSAAFRARDFVRRRSAGFGLR
ncbi:hypothetical protein Dimus_029193 [Dionaea muscipula]